MSKLTRPNTAGILHRGASLQKHLDDMGVSVGMFLTVAATVKDAVQMAVDYAPDHKGPVTVSFPRGEYEFTDIVIPRRGVNLKLGDAVLKASSGVMFKRQFTQTTAETFKATYQPVRGKHYFLPITVEDGIVELTDTARFIDIRQPYLWEYTIGSFKTLTVDRTNITVYDTASAFGIHGGWGFFFNNVNVNGDLDKKTGFGNSVGSGLVLDMRPDGTYHTASHAQLIQFNGCFIGYTKLVDSNKGTNDSSCEALYFFDCNMMMVEGGYVDACNLFEMSGGIFVTTAKELILNRMAGAIIRDMQVQRYNNPRTDERYGVITFVGGGSDISVRDIRSNFGSGVTGSMICVEANNNHFIDVAFSDIQCVGDAYDAAVTDVNKQTSVVRLITRGTGTIVGCQIHNITGRSVHNIVDMGDQAATGSMRRFDISDIRNISTDCKRRVRGLSANVQSLVAPQLFQRLELRMRGTSNSSGGNEFCKTDTLCLGMTGTIIPTRITTANVSNATSLAAVDASLEGGGVSIGLYQAAGLPAGARVEATATFEFNSSESILA
ncbi:hypothetical protein phD2B_0048 [Lelliottia phage phD2B]|uniref:Uncharacterized protein n=1 Tax=Lelliottia phage phD2B TaxID=1542498 RepID=A0A088FWZ6_9CAUD|nr:hypothetical protein phD2B_0048 [Lelliottia phage phD2B]AIM51274.1 hypothetical protein phD2B_0048 [Lelliottia phage phD2B]